MLIADMERNADKSEEDFFSRRKEEIRKELSTPQHPSKRGFTFVESFHTCFKVYHSQKTEITLIGTPLNYLKSSSPTSDWQKWGTNIFIFHIKRWVSGLNIDSLVEMIKYNHKKEALYLRSSKVNEAAIDGIIHIYGESLKVTQSPKDVLSLDFYQSLHHQELDKLEYVFLVNIKKDYDVIVKNFKKIYEGYLSKKARIQKAVNRALEFRLLIITEGISRDTGKANFEEISLGQMKQNEVWIILKEKNTSFFE